MKTYHDFVFDDTDTDSGSNLVSPSVVIFYLIGAIIIGLTLGIALISLCSWIFGIDFQGSLATLDNRSAPWLSTFMRCMIAINHLTMFVLPAVWVLYAVFKSKRWQSVGLHEMPRPSKLLLGTLFMLFMFPIAQYAMVLNKQIPMPEWMHSMESSINSSISALLTVSNPWTLLLNIVVIAAIPALGEELVFRGILQGQLARKIGPIAAIWASAFIFSAFHLQFEGFLARMILGASLGYLYYWTGSLWTPIVAHFLNNGLQVIAAAYVGKELDSLDIKSTETLPWYVLLACMSAAWGLGIIIQQRKISVLPENEINA